MQANADEAQTAILSSWLLYPSRQWTPLYAESRSKGSHRIHLTFDYIINTNRLVSDGEPCTLIQPNSPASDEVIRSYQPESLNIQSDTMAPPTTASQELSEAQPTTSVLQEDSSYQPPIGHQRFFLDLFAGHSAALTVAAKAANLDHFCPFDIEFNHLCNILDDNQFEHLLQLAHAGLIGAIWSGPPCKLYSQLRKDDGGPPPLRTKEHLDGLPSLSPHQLLQVQESKEIHRRSSMFCIVVFQQKNSL